MSVFETLFYENGTINLEEIRNWFMTGCGLTLEQADKVILFFPRYSTREDEDTIKLIEFIAYGVKLFKGLDSDDDGVITNEEFREKLNLKDANLAEKLIKLMDIDKDGTVGVDEFINMCNNPNKRLKFQQILNENK
jgi:Ca2+-binding EF-hand superfamily protein